MSAAKPREYSVRPARSQDADAISVIYNEGIADRATLETESRTPDERRSWLAARDARHPVVVVEADGVVVGWASLNVFNARDAYPHFADISVYVARASRGKGAGIALLHISSSSAARSASTSWCWRDSRTTTASVDLMERLL